MWMEWIHKYTERKEVSGHYQKYKYINISKRTYVESEILRIKSSRDKTVNKQVKICTKSSTKKYCLFPMCCITLNVFLKKFTFGIYVKSFCVVYYFFSPLLLYEVQIERKRLCQKWFGAGTSKQVITLCDFI
jgi:hypothetical protein